MGEKHDRTSRFADETPRDIAQEWMEHDLFLERTRNDHVDLVFADCAQDAVGRIALLIMDGGIERQRYSFERMTKRRRRLLGLFADVNQLEIGAKPITNPFRLGQNLLEPRRESAGHRDRFVGRRFEHGATLNFGLTEDSATARWGRTAAPFAARSASAPYPQSIGDFSFAVSCTNFRNMRRAIYPGSFDPVTNGHLDVIERARKLFDEVIVAVAHNDEKEALFSLEERLDLLNESIGKIDNVRVAQFEGLLVQFAAAQKASAVIRGLRAVSDFEFEFQMALMNRKLETNVETIFLMPKEEYTYLSSRIIKEIARLGGDVSSFVPTRVGKALARKFAR